MSIIPYLPLQNLTGPNAYAIKLIILHFAFSFMGYFLNSFNVVGNLVTFMTPNSQERQRMYSIVPIVTGLVPSIIGIFFPMLIGLTGGYQKILTYKIFVPIFAILGVAVTFCTIKCKERIIEQHCDNRKKVKFWKGAKQVLSNKYLWITNIAGIMGLWSGLYGGILQWWFIYSLRMEWFYGIAANIVVVSMTLGNVLTPILTRKFQKKTILIWSRLIAIGTILLMLLAINIPNVIGSVILFMFAMFLRNGIGPVEGGVSSGIGPDIMDYHQWKYGERADSMCGVFGWFLGPISMVLGYVIPILKRGVGFTSDYDVLYNQGVLTQIFIYYIIFSIISTVMATIPFFFYDFTKEKHDLCIKELQERLAKDDVESNGGGDDGGGGGGDGDEQYLEPSADFSNATSAGGII